MCSSLLPLVLLVSSKMSSVLLLFDFVSKIESHGHKDYAVVCFAGLCLIAVFIVNIQSAVLFGIYWSLKTMKRLMTSTYTHISYMCMLKHFHSGIQLPAPDQNSVCWQPVVTTSCFVSFLIVYLNY